MTDEHDPGDGGNNPSKVLQIAIRHSRIFGDAMASFLDGNSLMAAGNMAFLGMLSLFPFLIFLVSLSGLLGQTEAGQEAIVFLLDNMPEEVASAMKAPILAIVSSTRTSFLTLSIAIAIWTAGSGVEAARDAILSIYGRQHSPGFLRRKIESIIIVLSFAAFGLIAMSALIMGPAARAAIEALLPLPDATDRLLAWLNYGIAPTLLFLAILGLYRVLTPKSAFSRRYYFPGAAFALLVWMASAWAFSTYLSYFNTYNLTYGGLAGIVIAQLFLFVISIAFILGAQLNAAYARGHIEPSNEQEPQTADN